jgi:hypothetical protein
MQVRVLTACLCNEQTEKSFLRDLWGSIYGKLYGMTQGWPAGRYLGGLLSGWEAKLSVGYKELTETELFPSPKSVASFLKFYGQYDFCDPIPVNKFGIPPEETNYWLNIGATAGEWNPDISCRRSPAPPPPPPRNRVPLLCAYYHDVPCFKFSRDNFSLRLIPSSSSGSPVQKLLLHLLSRADMYYAYFLK